jgi:predicted nucleotidyltransferase
MDFMRLSEVAKKYNLLTLVLFGSRAVGNEREDSDYDFAYFSKSELDSENYIDLFNDIMELVGNENIDLIDINKNKSHLLRYEIFSKGKCVYEYKKGFFNNLKIMAWFDYKDYEHYYEKQSEIIKKGIEMI